MGIITNTRYKKYRRQYLIRLLMKKGFHGEWLRELVRFNENIENKMGENENAETSQISL